jgi:outer membrane receptor protein involved in Fe transport
MQAVRAMWTGGTVKLGSAIILAHLMATTAMAQTAAAPAPADKPSVEASEDVSADPPLSGEAIQDIIVTGTRVERAGFSAPTPVTVLGNALLVERAPSVLVDAIKLLPAARNTSTPSTGGQVASGSGGGSFVNLRGLGPTRTLVLLNGQRMIPTSNIGTVDIAVLPQSLVKRVDIVTGGASAAYGSDAVAGVANVVLDTDLKGLRANIEGGTSTHGDAGSQKISAAWGGDIGDRLHVLVGGEYYHQATALVSNRHDLFYAVNTVANPDYTPTNGQKSLIVSPYVYLNNMTFGGLILGGPLANTQFLPNGATAPYAPCGPVTGTSQACGGQRDDLTFFQRVVDLTAPQRRVAGYGNMAFELSASVKLYADFLYGESRTQYHSVPPATAVLGAYTIDRNNAFLPAEVASRMDQLGVRSFQLGRYSDEFGRTEFNRFTNVKRGSFGIDADLGSSWKATGYLAYSESNYNWRNTNIPVVDLFRNAVDAVVNPANGQVVCRSTLANPRDGCIPINLFGVGAPDLGAKSYAYGVAVTRLHSSEFAAGGSISGEPFSTWAGPVSVAAGVEYRSDQADQTVDAIQLASRFAYSNQQPLNGSIRVKEGYLETVVPLTKDMIFAKTLELNGAVRVTDYSTSGTVTTWKIGGNYEPFQGLRFRAVRSRDIRAPNILELNSKRVVAGSANTAIDPRTNTLIQFPAYTSGNPFLKPEIANTLSVGGVFNPAFLPRFNLSLDYYQIKVGGAIQTLSSQQTLNECASGDTVICSFIAYDAQGNVTSVTNAFSNLAKITTSGFDLEASYRLDVAGGTLDLHVLGNYLKKYVVDTGTARIDYAGDMLTYGIPKLGIDLGASYRHGGTSVSVDGRRIGSGKYSVASASLIENNHIGAVWIFGAGVEQRVATGARTMTLYLRGENIFNAKPPVAFPTAGGNYDRVGPYIKLGARVQM